MTHIGMSIRVSFLQILILISTLSLVHSCTSNTECSLPTPVCSGGTCVGCAANSDCTTYFPTLPYCKSNTCVQCVTNSECGGSAPRCSGYYTCVQCLTPLQCGGAKPYCNSTKFCAQCLTNAECSAVNASTPYCSYDNCVTCVTNAECTQPNLGVCGVNSTCVQCQVNSDCPSSTHVCTPNHVCVECMVNTDCPTNYSCNSLNLCVQCLINSECATNSPATPVCYHELCVECVTDSNCTTASPACDPNFNICRECLDNSYCTANASLPVCDLNTYICVGCYQNEDCSANNEVCDLDTATCVNCVNNEECYGNNPVCQNHVCVPYYQDGYNLITYIQTLTLGGLTEFTQILVPGTSSGITRTMYFRMYLYLRYLNASFPPILEQSFQNATPVDYTVSIPIPEFIQNASDYYNAPWRYARYGVGSLFIVNFWNYIVTLAAGCLFTILLFILDKASKGSCFEAIFHPLSTTFAWNVLVAYAVPASANALLFTMIEFLSINDSGQTLIMLGSLIFDLALQVSFAVMWVWIMRKLGKLQQERETVNENEENLRYRILFYDWKWEARPELCYLFIFFMRGVCNTLIITMVTGSAMVQLIIYILINIVTLVYLFKWRPLVRTLRMMEHVFYEMTLLAINTILFMIELLNDPSSNTAETYGWSVYYLSVAMKGMGIIFTLLELFIFIIPIVYSAIKSVIQSIKDCLTERSKRPKKIKFKENAKAESAKPFTLKMVGDPVSEYAEISDDVALHDEKSESKSIFRAYGLAPPPQMKRRKKRGPGFKFKTTSVASSALASEQILNLRDLEEQGEEEEEEKTDAGESRPMNSLEDKHFDGFSPISPQIGENEPMFQKKPSLTKSQVDPPSPKMEKKPSLKKTIEDPPSPKFEKKPSLKISNLDIPSPEIHPQEEKKSSGSDTSKSSPLDRPESERVEMLPKEVVGIDQDDVSDVLSQVIKSRKRKDLVKSRLQGGVKKN